MKNEYFIIGKVLYIIAHCKGEKHEIKVDADDLNLLNSFGSWNLHNHPRTKGLVVTSRIDKKMVYMSRVVMGSPKGLEVDHINRNTLDNRKENLRCVTSSENKQNRSDLPRHNTSGVRGVQWNKQKKKWHVAIVISGKRMHGGYFDKITDAEKRVKELRAMYAPLSPEAVENKSMSRPLSEFNNDIRSDNTSGVRGVDWSKQRNKYRARVFIDKKEVTVGFFETIEEAAAAVKQARERQ